MQTDSQQRDNNQFFKSYNIILIHSVYPTRESVSRSTNKYDIYRNLTCFLKNFQQIFVSLIWEREFGESIKTNFLKKLKGLET